MQAGRQALAGATTPSNPLQAHYDRLSKVPAVLVSVLLLHAQTGRQAVRCMQAERGRVREITRCMVLQLLDRCWEVGNGLAGLSGSSAQDDQGQQEGGQCKRAGTCCCLHSRHNAYRPLGLGRLLVSSTGVILLQAAPMEVQEEVIAMVVKSGLLGLRDAFTRRRPASELPMGLHMLQVSLAGRAAAPAWESFEGCKAEMRLHADGDEARVCPVVNL